MQILGTPRPNLIRRTYTDFVGTAMLGGQSPASSFHRRLVWER
jgi:hypothetical protein